MELGLNWLNRIGLVRVVSLMLESDIDMVNVRDTDGFRLIPKLNIWLQLDGIAIFTVNGKSHEASTAV